MSSPLEKITEGLKNKTNEQESKINFEQMGKTIKGINAPEPFRVTSITFFNNEEPTK